MKNKTAMTIPDKIIKQTELLQKASCKVLYLAGYIFDKCIASTERTFTESNEQLSKKFGLTERCISETIGALVKSEALTVLKLKPRTLQITKSTVSAIVDDYKKRSALIEKLGKKVEPQFYEGDSDRTTVPVSGDLPRTTVLPKAEIVEPQFYQKGDSRTTVLPDTRTTVLPEAQNPLKKSELEGEISKSASKENFEVSHKENISTISNISNSKILNNNIINTPTAHTHVHTRTHTHEGEVFVTIKNQYRMTLDELSVRGFSEIEKEAFLTQRNGQDYPSIQSMQLDAREWIKTHRKDNPRPKREVKIPSAEEIRDYFTEKTGLRGKIASDFATTFIKQYEPYGWKYGKYKDKPLVNWKGAISSSWDLEKFIKEHGKSTGSNYGSRGVKVAPGIDLDAAIARRSAKGAESQSSDDFAVFDVVE